VAAGVCIGLIFVKAIESITRQPEMRVQITTAAVARLRTPRCPFSTGSSPACSRGVHRLDKDAR